MAPENSHGPRVVALVGPYGSGKTTVMESMLATAGAINRRGAVKDANTIGDGSPEARARGMSTTINVASLDYLDEPWTIIDCPGSVEFSQYFHDALMVCDTAVVICEPEPEKAVMLAPILHFLDERNIPHLVFINKIEHQGASVRTTLEALQAISERPMVLREIPIRDGDEITGFVDLVSERAYAYKEGEASELIGLPDAMTDLEATARTEMLESLADFDDTLMEELLDDIEPSKTEIYENLGRDLENDLLVPVFFGSGQHIHGITRLWKALRHETPSVGVTRQRLGITGTGFQAQVFKTLHAGHLGKLSLSRIWSGKLTDGDQVVGTRPSGIFTLFGETQNKCAAAEAGSVVALGRLGDVTTGMMLNNANASVNDKWPPALSPLLARAIRAEKRGDEVKMTETIAKLVEEDPSISTEQAPDTGEFLLWGQGEMHLQIAIDRLENRFGMKVLTEPPQVPYKECIRAGADQHARHRKQSGGHGEFGDVHITIKPQPRGSGFAFSDSISGGAVPKQYIPAVEAGVVEALTRGPLGFPVVDIAVTLTDGQFHSVDSSEMAFRKAASKAMREALPNCKPVLLEPICLVKVALPNIFTSKIQRIMSGRRGQILGFDAMPGWTDWDQVEAKLPQSEMTDLIIELRSMTLGVGTFSWAFDHLQEFEGKQADAVIAAQAKEH